MRRALVLVVLSGLALRGAAAQEAQSGARVGQVLLEAMSVHGLSVFRLATTERIEAQRLRSVRSRALVAGVEPHGRCR